MALGFSGEESRSSSKALLVAEKRCIEDVVRRLSSRVGEQIPI